MASKFKPGEILTRVLCWGGGIHTITYRVLDTPVGWPNINVIIVDNVDDPTSVGTKKSIVISGVFTEEGIEHRCIGTGDIYIIGDDSKKISKVKSQMLAYGNLKIRRKHHGSKNR